MSLDKKQQVFDMEAFIKAEVEKQRQISKQGKIDVYRSALNRLWYDGFYADQAGTIYIAKLIDVLYHERELLKRFYKRPSFKGYWNLNDKSNPHYFLLGDSEKVISSMRKSIVLSQYEEDDTDICELVYDLTDREMARNLLYHGASKEDVPSYKLLLKGQYKESKEEE